MEDNKIELRKKMVELEDELSTNQFHFKGSDVLDWQHMMSLIDDINELLFTKK